jgi:hypothetical protein
MLGRTALLFTDDRTLARTIAAHLRCTGTEVAIAGDAAAAGDLLGARAVDLALIDGASAGALDVVDRARGATPIIVLGRGDPAETLAMVCDREVAHVLARSGDDEAALVQLGREVAITTEKLLRGDRFGIEKYLPSFGAELSTAEVRCAEDRDEVVAAVSAYAGWLGAGGEARRAIAAIVDELVTNAVYDAPRDAEGNPRYAAVDRRHKVRLDPGEEVAVRWASDGEMLAVSVSDAFGALRADHVRKGLRRCLTAADPIEQKAGGAGLGIYTAIAYSTQLVVNVERGKRTEVIAIVDLRRGGARRGGRSLHLFFDPVDLAGVPAPIETVTLSDTMRVDLRTQLAQVRRRPDVVPLELPKRAPTARRRGRGSSPPPLPSIFPIGADTARGLLRGAVAARTAIDVALRFLEHHYQAAVAFELDGEELAPRQAGRRVRDWAQLRQRSLPRDNGLVEHAGQGVTTMFRLSRVDEALTPFAAGASDVDAVVVPLSVGGDLRWILFAARPLEAVAPAADVIEPVRRELEACLGRLDELAPIIEVGS